MKLRARHVEYLWDALNGLLCALVIAILLGGCASFDYDWRKVHPAAPKPWQRVMVADADATCRKVGAVGVGIERILACATWRQDGCTIYMQANTPAWAMSHEARHCEGWTHI